MRLDRSRLQRRSSRQGRLILARRVATALRSPRSSIAIAQIEPQDAIVAKNAADLAGQLHHAVDIVVRRLLQPHLAISPIVAQAILGRAGYAALDRADGNNPAKPAPTPQRPERKTDGEG